MSRNAHCSPGIANAIAILAILLLMGALAGPLRADNPPAPLPASEQGRVVIVKDPDATYTFQVQPGVVQGMLDRAITNLTGSSELGAAWRQIVSTQDIVGIKVYSLPGPSSGTRPAVVAAVIQGLLAAGLPSTNIVIWDKQATHLRLSGFYHLAERYHVRVASAFQAGYDEHTFYESAIIGNLVWGDLEFGKSAKGAGRRSFVSRLLTHDITRIINVVPLFNHNLAGVSGNLYSLTSGSVDNFARFESDPARLATAIPEIYALPALSDRVALHIMDATLCQYEGSERSLLHYSTALNELWVSRDPVALDSLAVRELERQRQREGAAAVNVNFDIYSNAALLELGISEVKKLKVERIP